MENTNPMVVAIEHLTLDGVYQAPARPDEDCRDGFEYGGWAVAGNDPVMQKVMRGSMGSSWSLLVGRFTYEDLFGFWPKQPSNPMTDALNKVKKFIASTTQTKLFWENSRLLQGDVPDAVERLKQVHGKTLVIFGSGILVQSLMQRDLIDEYILMIHPLVLGKGRRLFPDGTSQTKLTLVDSITTNTGVIIATYRLISNR